MPESNKSINACTMTHSMIAMTIPPEYSMHHQVKRERESLSFIWFTEQVYYVDIQIQTWIEYFDWVHATGGSVCVPHMKMLLKHQSGTTIQDFFNKHRNSFKPRVWFIHVIKTEDYIHSSWNRRGVECEYHCWCCCCWWVGTGEGVTERETRGQEDAAVIFFLCLSFYSSLSYGYELHADNSSIVFFKGSPAYFTAIGC